MELNEKRNKKKRKKEERRKRKRIMVDREVGIRRERKRENGIDMMGRMWREEERRGERRGRE